VRIATKDIQEVLDSQRFEEGQFQIGSEAGADFPEGFSGGAENLAILIAGSGPQAKSPPPPLSS